MLLKSIDDRVLPVFVRLIAALCDPQRRYRVAFLACLAYAALWALYATVAKSSQGINADLGEMVVWAHHLAWGYPKHPPLPALILAGWFAVFPQADWAYYVLAGLNLSVDAAMADDRASGRTARLYESEDSKEGPLAFAEKRKPQWKGR